MHIDLNIVDTILNAAGDDTLRDQNVRRRRGETTNDIVTINEEVSPSRQTAPGIYTRSASGPQLSVHDFVERVEERFLCLHVPDEFLWRGKTST